MHLNFCTDTLRRKVLILIPLSPMKIMLLNEEKNKYLTSIYMCFKN